MRIEQELAHALSSVNELERSSRSLWNNNLSPAEMAEGLARRPEGESQIAEIFYLLCKYLVFAATRGIFPKENISAISAISAGPQKISEK